MADPKQDAARFQRYTRMSLDDFDKLLGLLGDKLVKHSHREALCPEQRLIITLRFLSSGDSFHSLSTNFCVGISTASSVVHEVCNALAEKLAPTYLATPNTTAEWLEIADGFCGKWQLPNALGAIDGKHITIRAPANSGSLYYNYKQFFSANRSVKRRLRHSRRKTIITPTSAATFRVASSSDDSSGDL